MWLAHNGLEDLRISGHGSVSRALAFRWHASRTTRSYRLAHHTIFRTLSSSGLSRRAMLSLGSGKPYTLAGSGSNIWAASISAIWTYTMRAQPNGGALTRTKESAAFSALLIATVIW